MNTIQRHEDPGQRQYQLFRLGQAVANHLPATFYWPNAEFSGHHICDNGISGINDLVAAPTGPGDFSCPGSPLPCASMESYHPNNTGTPSTQRRS